MRTFEHLRDFKNFEVYAKALVESKDVDPVYPLLKEIIRFEGFDPTEAIFWYGYFYSISSMVKLLRKEIDFSQAKFGTERGRTPQVRRPENMAKTLAAWHRADVLIAAREAKNARVFANTVILPIPYFGNWVSYKYTELFEKVLDFTNLAPTDMNLEGADLNDHSGPCGGLRKLYGEDDAIYPRSMVAEWETLGQQLSQHWGYDLGQVETILCKGYKWIEGKYYVGHDIAEFKHLESLWSPQDFETLMSRAGFDAILWEEGVLNPRKRLYKDSGIIYNQHYAEKHHNGKMEK